MLLLLLSSLCCLPKNRELLEFDLSTTVDVAVEGEVVMIGAAKDEVVEV